MPNAKPEELQFYFTARHQAALRVRFNHRNWKEATMATLYRSRTGQCNYAEVLYMVGPRNMTPSIEGFGGVVGQQEVADFLFAMYEDLEAEFAGSVVAALRSEKVEATIAESIARTANQVVSTPYGTQMRECACNALRAQLTKWARCFH